MRKAPIHPKYKTPAWFGVRYGFAEDRTRRYLCRTAIAMKNSILVPNGTGDTQRLYDAEAVSVHIAMKRLVVIRDNKKAANLRRGSPIRGELPPEIEKDAFYHWWFYTFKKRHLLDRKRRVICVRRP